MSAHVQTETDVYRKADRCAMPHDVCVLAAGDIFVTFREATNHRSPDGAIMSVRSRDNGVTWGEQSKIEETPGVDYRDPSVTELSDGTLLLTFFAQEKGNGVIDGGSYVVVRRSFDNGKTWPDRIVVPNGTFGFVMTTERCIELPGGDVLMPAQAGSRKERFNAGTVFRSSDKGATWRFFSTISSWPYSENEGWWAETAIERTAIGSILAVVRTDRGMVMCTSLDDGLTWTKPVSLEFSCAETQPSLTRLASGTILLSYGERGPSPRYRGPRKDPPDFDYSIVFSASRDHGETWEAPVTLRSGLPHWDMGYPTTRELPDGTLITVYWWSDPHPENDWPKGWQYTLSALRWTV